MPTISLATLTSTLDELPGILNTVSADLLSGSVLGLGAVSSGESVTPVGLRHGKHRQQQHR